MNCPWKQPKEWPREITMWRKRGRRETEGLKEEGRMCSKLLPRWRPVQLTAGLSSQCRPTEWTCVILWLLSMYSDRKTNMEPWKESQKTSGRTKNEIRIKSVRLLDTLIICHKLEMNLKSILHSSGTLSSFCSSSKKHQVQQRPRKTILFLSFLHLP